MEENTGYFRSFEEIITEATNFTKIFDVMTARLLELVDQFQNEGSGWQFNRIEYFDISINPFQPISGSSYIKLPEFLAKKKAVIDVKNENDNECFKWAVTSAVFQKDKDPQRLTKEMKENSEKFDWKGIECPVSLKDIDKFEKQNLFAINVFGFDGKEVYSLRISKCENSIIRLLLISD